MNYSESVHMRLSTEQKAALMNISSEHRVTMSTALRWMIDYCMSEPNVLDAIVDKQDEEVVEDGVV